MAELPHAAEDTSSSDLNEFYWDTFFVKVEDKLFCVPRYEFVQSSEVFADMFLLPSGPATRSEGQDRDHPIVLEGYKKDEFACLLKVMYPTATSLISGKNLELHLKKEEWVSVLKLSTIWNMTKIRQYAIHRLSTDEMFKLSPIEKILLARAHRVAAWLDEAVTSLATLNPIPKLEDLAILGWETVAQILWIRDNFPLNTLRFRRDAIQCQRCSSTSSLINSSYGCGHIVSGDAELLITSGSGTFSGTTDLLVSLQQMQCSICKGTPFNSIVLTCSSSSCSFTYYARNNPIVRVARYNNMKTMIEEMFGEEIKDHEPEPSLLDSDPV